MKNRYCTEDKRVGWLATLQVGWIVVVKKKSNFFRTNNSLGFSAKVERITPSGQIIVGNPGKPSIKFMADGFHEDYQLDEYTKEWQTKKTRSNQLYHIKRLLDDVDFTETLSATEVNKIYSLLKSKEGEKT